MWNDWGNHGMMGYDGTGWWSAMGLHGIAWVLFAALLILAAVALIRHPWRAGSPGPYAMAGDGLAVLERRYARGEIERDEYLRKKQDLS